jgi:PHD/YefM family antitoxin component YafN of YafNO toxin-antitoxin module
MNILSNAIISNSQMIRDYKACREMVEILGKILIMDNNQPDAILFSVAEYEPLSVFIECLESLKERDIVKFTLYLQNQKNSMDLLRNDIMEG